MAGAVTVLVTGAGGYVGGLVARRYRDTGADVVAHGRGMGDLADSDPFASIPAEVRQRITHIVHSGALTRFDVDREAARQVNVEGTARLLEFARHCPGLRSLGVVSTVYATGLRAGPIGERLYDDGPGFANDYEWSKWQAEQVVVSAGADLPWRILRVATVIADDTSGAVTQYNAFHETLKLWFHGLLPLVPGDAATPLYLVTGDFVADVTISLMDRDCEGVFHLAHAPAESLTLGQSLDVVAEAFEAVDAFRRRRVLRPLLADERAFELLARGVTAFGGGLVRQSLQSVLPFARQLFVAKELDNSRLRSALGSSYRAPDAASLVRRTCDRLIATRWGRGAVA